MEAEEASVRSVRSVRSVISGFSVRIQHRLTLIKIHFGFNKDPRDS